LAGAFATGAALGAAVAGLLTVLLTELLTRSRLVREDAAIGLVFPAMFALAVLIINVYASNVHLDADAVLLGEIGFAWLDVIDVGGQLVPRSLLVLSIITLVNGLFIVLLFKELKLATFDAAWHRHWDSPRRCCITRCWV
jgi:manganese/zinc/iron transport system permease protein